MYYVYLLLCADDTIYTGITTDVARRLAEHKAGVGARYTRAKGVKKVLYVERKRDRGKALRREAEIKRWSRRQKLEFVRKAPVRSAARIHRDRDLK